MRSLHIIAKEIRADWKNVSPYAKGYLQAMDTLNTVNDKYYLDSGYSIVAYFLANAGSWRGDTARRIKKELKGML